MEAEEPHVPTHRSDVSSSSDDLSLPDLDNDDGRNNRTHRRARPLPDNDVSDSDSDSDYRGSKFSDHGNDRKQSDSDSDSLPSIEGNEEETHAPYSDSEEEGYHENDLAVNGSGDESLPSVDENDAQGEEVIPAEAHSGPVRGFRVRVDEDGEEIMEFASEDEELEDSEDDEVEDPDWLAHLGVQPAMEFALPFPVTLNIAARVGLNNRRQRQSSSSVVTSAGRQPDQRIVANEVPPPQGTEPQPGPSTSRAHASVARPRRRPSQRKKRRKKASKKRPVQKPRAPPKPLGPLVLHVDWDGNDDYKIYKKLITKRSHHRLCVNFKDIQSSCGLNGSSAELSRSSKQREEEEDEDFESEKVNNSSSEQQHANVNESPSTCTRKDDEDEDEPEGSDISGYNVTQIQFDRCSLHPWPWRNKRQLLEAHPDISEFILLVSETPGSSIIHMKTKRTTQEILGPLPKLSVRDQKRELIFVATQHYFFHVDPVGVPADMFSYKGLGQRKTFALDFHEFDPDKQCFLINVVLLESAILGDHDVHEIPGLKHPMLQNVFTNFFGVAPPPPPLPGDSQQKEDLAWFYGQIRKYHKKETLPLSEIPLQPSSLKPTLRDYQRDAVHWMLFREGCLEQFESHSSPSSSARTDLITAFLDKMYIPLELTRYKPNYLYGAEENKIAFYNPYTTYFCWKKPTVPPLPSGGILCDEMGLGKTVETLCLILLNQKKLSDEMKDYVEDKLASGELETEFVSGDESSSSWEDVSEDDSSSSDGTSGRKRKKRGGKGGSKGKKARKSNKKVNPPTRAGGRRRKRAASPCEFIAAEGDEEQSSPQRRKSTSELTIASPSSRRKSTEAGSPEKKKESNYEILKRIYDAQLNDYKYAEMARCTPKFHGKFYDTDIEMQEFFECICGEDGEYVPVAEIVKCSVCSSSQHAECVGFDANLKMLYQSIGRQYLCPHCEVLQPPLETKSTLIITPPSISHQWIREIQKHVRNHRLSILFYKGVGTHGYLPPAKLARYDIVITTYTVLSSELDYVDLPHCNSSDGRRFRNPKRFLTIPSPLPNVLWWRVCLDEAQMVEGVETKMALMATRLRAVHRWCVTGTPVNKGLEDLFGLFVFLKLYPISYDVWWNELVEESFIRKDSSLLYELFGQMIWRTGKQDVLDQLGIPPQTEIVHWLSFSPVETHFYKQQFEICSNRILEKIHKLRQLAPDVDILATRLSCLDRASLHGLLAPFLELRQACCHPQIVRGKQISLQKGTLTMEELLDKLVKKAQIECHEDHRKSVSALNGMAGLLIIQERWLEATEKYRQVLQSAEKQKEHFQTDSLQLLHTMENLAEVLDQNHDGVPFTLRDESLRSECEEVRTKYMKKYADAVKVAQEAVTPWTQSVEESHDQFTMRKESWWVASLKNAQRAHKIDSLIQLLKQDLQDVTKQKVKTVSTLATKFHDRYGLEQVLIPLITQLEELRSSVLGGLEELQTSDPSAFVESAIRCHLRERSNSYYNDSRLEDGKCQLCLYHDQFLMYENALFKTDKRDKITRTGRAWQKRKIMGDIADDLTEQAHVEFLQQEAEDLKTTTEHVQLINEELRRGTWGDSELEVILKGVLRFARVNKLGHEITENGSIHMNILDSAKKEFKFLRILWRRIYDQVSALDELSQATTRLVAVKDFHTADQQPGPSNKKKIKELTSGMVEKNIKFQNINIIGYHEVEIKMAEMEAEFATGQEKLALNMGQLLYLKTLKRNGYGKRGTVNTEDCPICSIQLGKEWSVLRCGHSFCSECAKKMCPNIMHSFSCPLCRHSMKFADVSFVDTTENDLEEADPKASSSKNQGRVPKQVREVKGSHSTKVEAVVETLLQLQDTHPGEKCIIFSSWLDVLEIVAKALEENDIRYSLLNQSGRKFQENLDKFKEREDLQVLLMPLTFGGKGLNIIEATHVLLVEPILNLASELQAIGRVHRIGQTKPTFVHRFYVRRTIEDKLFTILKGQDVSSDEEGSLTVKDLQSLISSLPK